MDVIIDDRKPLVTVVDESADDGDIEAADAADERLRRPVV